MDGLVWVRAYRLVFVRACVYVCVHAYVCIHIFCVCVCVCACLSLYLSVFTHLCQGGTSDVDGTLQSDGRARGPPPLLHHLGSLHPPYGLTALSSSPSHSHTHAGAAAEDS